MSIRRPATPAFSNAQATSVTVPQALAIISDEDADVRDVVVAGGLLGFSVGEVFA